MKGLEKQGQNKGNFSGWARQQASPGYTQAQAQAQAQAFIYKVEGKG